MLARARLGLWLPAKPASERGWTVVMRHQAQGPASFAAPNAKRAWPERPPVPCAIRDVGASKRRSWHIAGARAVISGHLPRLSLVSSLHGAHTSSAAQEAETHSRVPTHNANVDRNATQTYEPLHHLVGTRPSFMNPRATRNRCQVNATASSFATHFAQPVTHALPSGRLDRKRLRRLGALHSSPDATTAKEAPAESSALPACPQSQQETLLLQNLVPSTS